MAQPQVKRRERNRVNPETKVEETKTPIEETVVEEKPKMKRSERMITQEQSIQKGEVEKKADKKPKEDSCPFKCYELAKFYNFNVNKGTVKSLSRDNKEIATFQSWQGMHRFLEGYKLGKQEAQTRKEAATV